MNQADFSGGDFFQLRYELKQHHPPRCFLFFFCLVWIFQMSLLKNTSCRKTSRFRSCRMAVKRDNRLCDFSTAWEFPCRSSTLQFSIGPGDDATSLGCWGRWRQFFRRFSCYNNKHWHSSRYLAISSFTYAAKLSNVFCAESVIWRV